MEKKSSGILVGFASRNSLLMSRFYEAAQPQFGRDISVLDFSKNSLGKWIKSVDTLLWDIDSATPNDIEILMSHISHDPNFDVIVLSHDAISSAERTSHVLMAGARVLLIVPGVKEEGDGECWARFVLDSKRELSLIQTRRNLRRIVNLTSDRTKPESKTKITARPELIVIGSSTGGPKALNTILSNFPQKLGVPILCVQHMPAGFTQSLAQGLNRLSPFTVVEAQDDQIIQSDTFYLAPGGLHMTVVKQTNTDRVLKVRLVDEPPVNNCRPAVDRLFSSVAQHFNGRVLAIVLTGMGSDGKAGVKALKEKEVYCITQDQASCTVYGMPRAVDQAGLSDEQVSLDELSQRIQTLIGKI